MSIDYSAPNEQEAINHPAHYNAGRIEVIEVIEDWRLGFHLGNVVKYVARALHKGRPVEDLKKARWYLRRYLDGARRDEQEPEEVRFDPSEVAADWGLDPGMANIIGICRHRAGLGDVGYILDSIINQLEE